MTCAHPDTWFDRSVCPEPCGAMHDRCTECGVVTGHPCPIEEYWKKEAEAAAEIRDYYKGKPAPLPDGVAPDTDKPDLPCGHFCPTCAPGYVQQLANRTWDTPAVTRRYRPDPDACANTRNIGEHDHVKGADGIVCITRDTP